MTETRATVAVLNAGALASLVSRGLAPALASELSITLDNESGGSIALAQSIRDGTKRADVYLSADAQANEILQGRENGDLTKWFVVFARNVVVLVYSPHSPRAEEFAQAVVGAVPWYEVLLRPGIRISRGDPNLDPLAYYT